MLPVAHAREHHNIRKRRQWVSGLLSSLRHFMSRLKSGVFDVSRAALRFEYMDFEKMPQIDVQDFEAKIKYDTIPNKSFLRLESPSNTVVNCDFFGDTSAIDLIKRFLPSSQSLIGSGAYALQDCVVSGDGYLIEQSGAALCGRQSLPKWALNKVGDYYCREKISDSNNAKKIKNFQSDSMSFIRKNHLGQLS